ncbi:MAG: GNAT family N-acetyltransferase [Myxococcales bacterium]|nr:GNAT family N-acetyltransferase [Myxococcales bacterium]
MGPLSPDLRGPDTELIERPGWHQIITQSKSGWGNEIALSELSEPEAEGVIDEVIAGYRARGLPTKWYVGYWTRPADFGERLERRGFSVSGVRGMGCETSFQVRCPEGVTVRQCSERNLEEYVAVTMRGWGNPPEDLAGWRERYLKGLRGVPRVLFHFGAWLGQELVGTSSLALRGDFGYLMGAQVLESARGKGAYRALIAARLNFLRERGIEYAVIQAQEATSAPILDHLGFESLFDAKCYYLAC